VSAARWRNWSRLVACTPAVVERPADVAGVVRAVREAAAAGRPLRVAGSGHSFTPLVESSGTLLSLDRLSGLVDLDRERTRATAWAGTSLRHLGALLESYGLAMENLGESTARLSREP